MDELLYIEVILENLEIVELQAVNLNIRRIDALDPFIELNDEQFRNKFRLSKELSQFVIDSV